MSNIQVSHNQTNHSKPRLDSCWSSLVSIDILSDIQTKHHESELRRIRTETRQDESLMRQLESETRQLESELHQLESELHQLDIESIKIDREINRLRSELAKDDSSGGVGVVFGIVLILFLLIGSCTSSNNENKNSSTPTSTSSQAVVATSHPLSNNTMTGGVSVLEEVEQPKHQTAISKATTFDIDKTTVPAVKPEYLDHDQSLPTDDTTAATAVIDTSPDTSQQQPEVPPIKEIQNYKTVEVPVEVSQSDEHSATANEITKRISSFTAQ